MVFVSLVAASDWGAASRSCGWGVSLVAPPWGPCTRVASPLSAWRALQGECQGGGSLGEKAQWLLRARWARPPSQCFVVQQCPGGARRSEKENNLIKWIEKLLLLNSQIHFSHIFLEPVFYDIYGAFLRRRHVYRERVHGISQAHLIRETTCDSWRVRVLPRS